MLSTLAEPTRLRIVELLAEAPRTVGEVAQRLGALQPQTSKHLQALEASGLVRVNRLGRRKVVALRREALAQLGEWFTALSERTPSEEVLERFAAAVVAEENRERTGGDAARRITLRRRLAASRSEVWRAWTTPELLARWWAPPHFEVLDAGLEPTPGGAVRLVLREGDGAIHRSEGQCVGVVDGRRLRFTLAPLDARGRPLFVPELEVALSDLESGSAEEGTDLEVVIDIRGARSGAASALAGLQPGWAALLDQLSSLVPGGLSDNPAIQTRAEEEGSGTMGA